MLPIVFFIYVSVSLLPSCGGFAPPRYSPLSPSDSRSNPSRGALAATVLTMPQRLLKGSGDLIQSMMDAYNDKIYARAMRSKLRPIRFDPRREEVSDEMMDKMIYGSVLSAQIYSGRFPPSASTLSATSSSSSSSSSSSIASSTTETSTLSTSKTATVTEQGSALQNRKCSNTSTTVDTMDPVMKQDNLSEAQANGIYHQSNPAAASHNQTLLATKEQNRDDRDARQEVKGGGIEGSGVSWETSAAQGGDRCDVFFMQQVLSLGEDDRPDCVVRFVPNSPSIKTSSRHRYEYNHPNDDGRSADKNREDKVEEEEEEVIQGTLWVYVRGTATPFDALSNLSWLTVTTPLGNYVVPSAIARRARNIFAALMAYITVLEGSSHRGQRASSATSTTHSNSRGNSSYTSSSDSDRDGTYDPHQQCSNKGGSNSAEFYLRQQRLQNAPISREGETKGGVTKEGTPKEGGTTKDPGLSRKRLVYNNIIFTGKVRWLMQCWIQRQFCPVV